MVGNRNRLFYYRSHRDLLFEERDREHRAGTNWMGAVNVCVSRVTAILSLAYRVSSVWFGRIGRNGTVSIFGNRDIK